MADEKIVAHLEHNRDSGSLVMWSCL